MSSTRSKPTARKTGHPATSSPSGVPPETVRCVWLSGEFVPEAASVVSAFDRGFLYGDGLFETMRVCRGRIPFWERHLARLDEGLGTLRFKEVPSRRALASVARALLARNGVGEGILRLQITRGVGARGYSPQGAGSPTVLLSTHPLPGGECSKPPTWRVITAAVRMWSKSPLNRVKSTSKALHVLARAEADDRGADEALLLNERGEVAEASGANVFWISDGCLLTPPGHSGALPGITRREVMRLANEQGLDVAECECRSATLLQAKGVFLTNSVWGPVEVAVLDGKRIEPSSLVVDLRAAWRESLRAASGSRVSITGSGGL